VCGRLDTSKCMNVIYRSRKMKENGKITLKTHDKIKLYKSMKKNLSKVFWG
jgi:hypothetical protein